MQKVLFTGASGFLGWNFVQLPLKDIELHGVYYRQQYEHPNVNWHRFNLIEEKKIDAFIDQRQPDVVIHAAAIAKANFCEEHPAFSHHINVYSSLALAEACKKRSIPFLFISSDLVFNGSSPPYKEDDFAYPLSRYGEQKRMVEEELLASFENSLICRLPVLFGLGPSYSQTFFVSWLDNLKTGKELLAFTDEIRTLISAREACKGLCSAMDYLINGGGERIFHLGGSEVISRYDFALLMAEEFELDDSCVVPKERIEVPMAAPRPENVALDSSLAASILQFNPPTLRQQLKQIKLT